MPPIPKPQTTKPAASAVLTSKNTALITGGASGIGLAFAQICRQRGMIVGIADRNATLLDQAKETLANGAPEDVHIFEMDVSKHEDWKALKTDVTQALGKVDLLMLNAGISGKGAAWGNDEYFETVRTPSPEPC
jgi:NAD(P)-dependent dehydrogenase (short-subunit alcohol dehydrogenase family)